MTTEKLEGKAFVVNQWDLHKPRRHEIITGEDKPVNTEIQDTLQPAPLDETTLIAETPETPEMTEAEAVSTEEVKSDPSHNWEKRYSDLRKHMSEKDKQILELKKSLDELQKAANPLPKTKEDINAFKANHSDLYDTIYSMIKSELIESSEDIRKQFIQLEEQQKSLSAEAARAEVRKSHPDLNDILASPEFVDWFKAQSPARQALIESDVITDVVEGLNLYKRDKGITKAKKVEEKKVEQTQAALAVTSSSKGTPVQQKKVWTESEISKLSLKEFAKFEAEITTAQREGRIHMDISGRR